MKIKAIVDGVEKWVELPKESVEQIRNGKIAETGYEEGEGDYFIFHVDGGGFVRSARKSSYSGTFIESQYASGNYYTSEKVAKANARADRLMWKLRKFAALNSSISRWKGNDECWEIYFDHTTGELKTDECCGSCQTLFSIYFPYEETARLAIAEFRDELMWYFTQYEPMIYN